MSITKVNRRDAVKLGGLSLLGVALANTVACENKTNIKDKPLYGQVALITGSARGIGKSIALRLAKNGANIAICDIAKQIESVPYPLATVEELENTRKEILATGVECLSFQIDVRDRNEMEKMANEIKSKWNRLDILVSNAGIASMKIFEDESYETWDDVINVNLGGTANSVRIALPLMKQNNYGRIICIASQLARKGTRGSSIYCASKWGMVGFAKSIALEVMGQNITCNTICPSATNTGMLNNAVVLGMLSSDNPTLEGLVEKWRKYSPIKPSDDAEIILSPEKIADVAELFCLPGAGHLSGTVFDVSNYEAATNLA